MPELIELSRHDLLRTAIDQRDRNESLHEYIGDLQDENRKLRTRLSDVYCAGLLIYALSALAWAIFR